MSSGKHHSPFKLPHSSTFYAGLWLVGSSVKTIINMEIAIAPGNVTVNLLEFREVDNATNYPSINQGSNPSAIQLDQQIQLRADWTQQGAIFGGFTAVEWEIELLPEMKGSGESPVFPPPPGNPLFFTVPYVTAANHNYAPGPFVIPAGTLPAGVYEFVIRLALRDAAGLYPIVAFQTLGYTQLFNA